MTLASTEGGSVIQTHHKLHSHFKCGTPGKVLRKGSIMKMRLQGSQQQPFIKLLSICQHWAEVPSMSHYSSKFHLWNTYFYSHFTDEDGHKACAKPNCWEKQSRDLGPGLPGFKIHAWILTHSYVSVLSHMFSWLCPGCWGKEAGGNEITLAHLSAYPHSQGKAVMDKVRNIVPEKRTTLSLPSKCPEQEKKTKRWGKPASPWSALK